MRRYVLLGKPALGIFGVLIGSLGGGVLFCLFALGLKFLFVFSTKWNFLQKIVL